MEELYQQELERILAADIVATNQIPTSMYEGEHAFQLMLYCMKLTAGGYRFKMTDLYRETLMTILSFIRDIFPRPKDFVSRRSRIREELETIGLGYMSKYIISHKGIPETYTIDIYPITYEQATFICRALFAW